MIRRKGTFGPLLWLQLAILAFALVGSAAALAHGKNKHSEADKPSAAEQVEAPTANADISAAPEAMETGHEPSNDAGVFQNLHPASVHFPIALLLLAAALEAWGMTRAERRRDDTVAILAGVGAASAVVAATLGWIHTGLWLGGDAIMQWHRWAGTLIAVLAVAIALLSMRKTSGRGWLRVGLFAIAAGLVVQGYLGGELAHGPDHLGIA